MNSAYETAVSEFIKLRNTMIEDLEVINKIQIEDPLNECLVRVFTRTLYTFIETSSYIWKQLAYMKDVRDLASGTIKEPRLSESENFAILEKSFYVDEAGRVKERVSFVEPARNLKFALRVFAKTHNLEIDNIFEDSG